MESALGGSLKTVLYIPLIPISGALFAIAGVIDTLQQSLFHREFTYWEGKGESKKGLPRKVFTWNVCMLFGGLPHPFGGVSAVTDRVDRVADKILASKADLISLQEVSEPAARLLFERLKGDYKHFYTRIDRETFVGLDSALFVASKMPLANPRAHSLPRMGLIRRSLFSFHIGPLNFLTTHLEPGLETADRKMRQRQVECILEKGILSNTVMLGDLNMERASEFQESALSKIFQDIFSCIKETATDFFSSKIRNIKDSTLSIDYILATNELGLTGELFSGYERGKFPLSDHHGLFAEVVSLGS